MNASAAEPVPSPGQTTAPTATPTQQTALLTVPEPWMTAAFNAVAKLKATGGAWDYLLDSGGDPAKKLAEGWADLALAPQGGGIPITERTLVFAVPFSSEWYDISLEEANAILNEGSPFVAVMDWADLPLDMKPLRVAGHAHDHPDYPFVQLWTLLASSGHDSAAREIAPFLQEELAVDAVIKLTAVGDIMLDRALGAILRQGEIDFPFARTLTELKAADLTLGNFESALGPGGAAVPKAYTFRAPIESVDAVTRAGFDLLSLANNHAMDYGASVLLDGRQALLSSGISTVGAGADIQEARSPVIREYNGLRLAVLGYVDVPVERSGFDTQSWTATDTSPGVAWANTEWIRTDVTAARQAADLVVVLLHSGYEYQVDPSPKQRAAAYAAVEAGAHLVIGHHSHVLQGIEYYREGVIVYGLGNFTFYDGGVTESVILHAWLNASGVRQLEWTPVILDEAGRPLVADGEDFTRIMRTLYDLTNALN